MAVDPFKQALKEVKDRFEDKPTQYIKDPVFDPSEVEEIQKMRQDWEKMEEQKAKEKNGYKNK